MDALHVRVYNVRFGDAILISVPEAPPGGPSELRHILIDVGNALGTEGGVDTVFEPVMQNVLKELAGHPLDLYIMTHEHMDHVQGLLHFQKNVLKKKSLRDALRVRYAWLTRSSHPDYYTPGTADYHEKAKKRKDMVEGFLAEAERYFRAAPDEKTDWIRGLMAINNPRATADCIDLIRGLAPGNTHYVYRGLDVAGKHPFREATFELWAPEEDTSTYYGPFQPVAFGAVAGTTPRARPTVTQVEPPRGVDAGAFYNLVERRRWGYGDNLMAIDSAANNTSIVFCLNWRGWRLLFPGDAEERSWKEMGKRGLLKPVHFFKISHHGSITGMLPGDLVNKVLRDDGTRRYAALSAYPDLKKQEKGEQKWTYQGVPEREVLQELKSRADLQQTIQVPDGGYIDYAFEGGTGKVSIAVSK
jgi:glyoxylase-like metal-dependent hydrolase (beta-lactamase superfamily II)